MSRRATPLVERAWRTWRRRYADRHEQVAGERQSFVAWLKIGATLDYDEIRPMLASAPRIPMLQVQLSQGQRRETAAGAFGMATYEAYRAAKRVYRVHPALAQGLVRATWPGTYPIDKLTLPVSGAAYEFPATADTEALTAVVFWDIVMHERRPITALCVAEIPGDDELGAIPGLRLYLPVLSNTPINGALAWLKSSFDAAKLSPADRAYASFNTLGDRPLTRLLINTLLYVQGDDDLVADVHPGKSPRRVVPRGPIDPRDDLREPDTGTIGVRYGAAIERWEIERARGEYESGTGRTMSPHLRAAHAHLYWTGEGRTEPRVHYLPPIPVHGGTKPGPTTIRPVR